MSASRFLLAAAVLAGCAQGHTPGGGDDGDDTTPDSRLQTIPDAFVQLPPIDAPPPPPDAPPACTVQQVQLLVNPSFDGTPAGTGWTSLSIPATTLVEPPPPGVTPPTPPNVGWLGGVYSASQRLYQDVAIPASATALQLRFSRFIATAESPGFPYDYFYADVMTPADTILVTLVTWTNTDANGGFAAITFPTPSAYAGQTVRINFEATTDSTLNTNFFIDSVQLLVTACL